MCFIITNLVLGSLAILSSTLKLRSRASQWYMTCLQACSNFFACHIRLESSWSQLSNDAILSSMLIAVRQWFALFSHGYNFQVYSISFELPGYYYLSLIRQKKLHNRHFLSSVPIFPRSALTLFPSPSVYLLRMSRSNNHNLLGA